MKKALIMAGLIAAVGAMAQGQFNPSNYNAKQKFFDVDGTTALGAGFQVQFFVGTSADPASLTPVGDLMLFTNAKTGAVTPGYFGIGAAAFTFDGTGKFPQYAPGTTLNVQVAVFQTAYSSFAAAFAAGPDSKIGATTLFTVKLTNPGAEPPEIPAALSGITSVRVAPAPEPSVIALGLLGAGALFLRRRK
jgi:MYXO-CTERM domain-containing protein